MFVICCFTLWFCTYMLGAAFESAYCCYLYRKSNNESWVHGSSHCEVCGHILSWWELIPVFGSLVLRGRCSHCHTFYGWKYLLLEVSAGFLASNVFLISMCGKSFEVVVFVSVGFALAMALATKKILALG